MPLGTLKKLTVSAVADELIEIFSRHGVPKRNFVLSGNDFTSHLLQELYQRIGINLIKTTPYHPQTDGFVERFNQILKHMLSIVIQEERRDWNTLVPFVLFAYH